MWELGLFGEMVIWGLGQDIYKMSLKHLVVPESMKVLSDPTVMEYVKKTEAN